ncbi:MAG: cysteine desulfurase [Rhodobacteraceae bacterium]|nr:MAG: cysteine desulfurase [Paracoccaceae bacterium]
MISVIIMDWIEFAVRWLHGITAIAWIGTSFYFIALDLGLKKNQALPNGVTGEEWQVHGGGFYHIQKYGIAPANLPKDLIWFKWESYATWLSGFALMAIVYYGGADLYLVDHEIAEISNHIAIALSIGSLWIGWVLYNLLCKSKLGNNSTLLLLILFCFLFFLSWFYTSIFSGRAAFLHLGAFTATIMTANVFFIIIPNQKIVVADLRMGKIPDPVYGVIAKQRSTHNNYLTLPVIFFMLSNHYPLAFAAELNWVIAPLVFLLGVSIRHFFNTYHSEGRKLYWTWGVSLLIFLVIIGLSSFRSLNIDVVKNDKDILNIELGTVAGVPEEVFDVVSARCSMCHSREPLWDGFIHPPKGFIIESESDIIKQAKQIYIHSGISRAMPPNNISYMEDEERLMIQAWFERIGKEN